MSHLQLPVLLCMIVVLCEHSESMHKQVIVRLCIVSQLPRVNKNPKGKSDIHVKEKRRSRVRDRES